MSTNGAILGAVEAKELFLPMLGTRLCAGFPSPADDFLEGAIDLNRWLVPRPAATYLWRVEGQSMIEAGIYDGDILIVDRSVTPAHGHVVVAVVNGEKSVKRLEQAKGRARLSFANSQMPTYQMPEGVEVEIWGVVTWNLHQQITKKK